MADKKIEDIASHFLSIFPLINKKLFKRDDTLQQSGLNLTHFFILKTIEHYGKLPTTQIGKKLSIQKSNLTPLIKKLIEKGYVERVPATHDRRVIYIQLTKSGESFLTKREDVLHRDVQERFQSLEEEDLIKLDESLKVLRDIISKLT